MKNCNCCKKSLGLDCFGKNNHSKDKLKYICLECGRKKKREYYSKNIELERLKGLDFYYKNHAENLKKCKEYRKTKAGLDSYCRASKKARLLYPEKNIARKMVYSSLRTGKILKYDCSYPTGNCRGRVEAHHWDYSKPLDVVWFCSKHHGLADRVKKLIDLKNGK